MLRAKILFVGPSEVSGGRGGAGRGPRGAGLAAGRGLKLLLSPLPPPPQAGKSVLANFVSESAEGVGGHVPTQGLR